MISIGRPKLQDEAHPSERHNSWKGRVSIGVIRWGWNCAWARIFGVYFLRDKIPQNCRQFSVEMASPNNGVAGEVFCFAPLAMLVQREQFMTIIRRGPHLAEHLPGRA